MEACRSGEAVAAPADAVQPGSALREEELLEAVFRWQIEDLASRGAAAPIYFLVGRDGGDPPRALVERLAADGMRVKPSSESRKLSGGEIEDLVTREHGMRLRARDVQPRPDGAIEVRAEAWAGDEGAEGATLILVPEGGGYRVREVKDTWIS